MFAALLHFSLAAGGAQFAAPSEANFRELIKFIQPDDREQAYKEINWRNEFWPAVLEAKSLGRPILFWTMNGHPLGCT